MTFKRLCRSCFTVFSAHVRCYSRTTRLSVKNDSFTNPCLKLRYIYVQTCVGLWDDVPDGVLLDVCYADSHPDGGSKVAALPTVLALHNSPGSHEDLVQLLEPFVSMGCRVVAPNFPGFGHTEGVTREHDDIFTHSNDEKSQFVCDFLQNVGIKRVDMIIGHGCGCYPLLRLCTSVVTRDIFKSVVLLSPWPVTEEFRLIQPMSLHKTIFWMWETSFYRPLAMLIAKSVKVFTGFSEFIVTDFICTSYTICGVDFVEVGGLATGMGHIKLPKLVLFGEDDEFVPSPLVEDLVNMLGIPTDEIIECNDKGVLQKSGSTDTYETDRCPRSVVFLDGGKNIHKQYSAVTIALLWKFLKTIRPEIR